MRIAALDIGTNSIHMIVVQVRRDGSFEVIDREKDMVRLGAGGLDGRTLSRMATTTAIQTLSKFKQLAETHRVDDVLAAATSAVREAKNGGEFLADVARRTGIRARVVSGVEEARLIHRAACYGVGVGPDAVVVIDIGGGSVEITLGTANRVRLASSFKIGVLRLTERFVRTDPVSTGDVRRMVTYIRQQLGSYGTSIRGAGFDRVIGSSGTILSLGTLAAGAASASPEERRNLAVPAKQLKELRKQLVAQTLEERLRIPGLDPRRADLSVTGAIVLDTILSAIGAKQLTLCDLALREGLVLDYIHSHRAAIALVERHPDVRRRSVIELADRFGYAPGHAEQIARLATTLFDQSRGVHGLGDRECEWLEFGALLHDVGGHISYERHHKHSYYLIRHGDLRGFTPHEVEVIALIARYHRRGTPKKRHAGYGDLARPLRRAVRVLSAFVRLAEQLDRSHGQVIGELHLQARATDFLLHLQTDQDAELEVWAAQRHAAPLEAVLGRPVRFEIGPSTRTRRSPTRRPSAPGTSRSRRGAVPRTNARKRRL